MFGPIGMPELIIIFIIALIVFGPRKLPELGKSLGRSIAEFKRASNELRHTLEEEIRLEETKPQSLRDDEAKDETKKDEPAPESKVAVATDASQDKDEATPPPQGTTE